MENVSNVSVLLNWWDLHERNTERCALEHTHTHITAQNNNACTRNVSARDSGVWEVAPPPPPPTVMCTKGSKNDFSARQPTLAGPRHTPVSFLVVLSEEASFALVFACS
eukprot:1737141-Amphidinium_carterae.1